MITSNHQWEGSAFIFLLAFVGAVNAAVAQKVLARRLRLSLAAASAQRYASVDLEMKSEGREKYKDSIGKTMGKVRLKDLRG